MIKTPLSKLQKHLNLLLIAVFLTGIIGLFYSTPVIYDVHAYSKTELCAFSSCSLASQQQIIEAHNNLLPPSYYQYGTKDWMKSFCTYNPNECK